MAVGARLVRIAAAAALLIPAGLVATASPAAASGGAGAFAGKVKFTQTTPPGYAPGCVKIDFSYYSSVDVGRIDNYNGNLFDFVEGHANYVIPGVGSFPDQTCTGVPGVSRAGNYTRLFQQAATVDNQPDGSVVSCDTAGDFTFAGVFITAALEGTCTGSAIIGSPSPTKSEVKVAAGPSEFDSTGPTGYAQAGSFTLCCASQVPGPGDPAPGDPGPAPGDPGLVGGPPGTSGGPPGTTGGGTPPGVQGRPPAVGSKAPPALKQFALPEPAPPALAQAPAPPPPPPPPPAPPATAGAAPTSASSFAGASQGSPSSLAGAMEPFAEEPQGSTQFAMVGQDLQGAGYLMTGLFMALAVVLLCRKGRVGRRLALAFALAGTGAGQQDICCSPKPCPAFALAR